MAGSPPARKTQIYLVKLRVTDCIRKLSKFLRFFNFGSGGFRVALCIGQRGFGRPRCRGVQEEIFFPFLQTCRCTANANALFHPTLKRDDEVVDDKLRDRVPLRDDGSLQFLSSKRCNS